MNKLLDRVEVNSINGLYLLYQYDDGNALPKLEIYQASNGIEVPVKNMYGEFKKLNDEFSFRIEFEPKDRTRLNTREFGNAFMKQFNKN